MASASCMQNANTSFENIYFLKIKTKTKQNKNAQQKLIIYL